MKVQISEVSNLVSTVKGEYEFSELGAFICRYDWAPAIFKESYRKSENFESADIVALDFDAGLTLAEAMEHFKDFRHIIGTTRNHQIEKNGLVSDRFRVLLFLRERIFSKEIYSTIIKSLHKMYPQVDRACKDPARFYYKCSQVVSLNLQGKLIDIEGDVVIEHQRTPVEITEPSEGRLSSATIRLLSGEVIKGERNNSLFQAALDALRSGYTEEWCFSKLAEQLIASDFSAEEARRCIESASQRVNHVGDGNKFKAFIRKSIMFVNVQDSSEAILVDETTGTRLPCCPRVIKDTLGSEEYKKHRNDGKVLAAKFEYNPYSQEVFRYSNNLIPYLNTYIKPDWRNVQVGVQNSIPELYEGLLKHLTCFDESPGSYNYLLDWMTNSLVSRNKTMLTLVGSQGVGKGVICDIFKCLVGKDNYYKAKDGVIKYKFNKPIKNKLIVNIDEIDIKNDSSAFDRLKDLVNDEIEIEGKGLDANNDRNFASFVISSNRTDCIRIESDDRRFSVIQLTDVPLRTTQYIEQVTSGYIFNDENIALLGNFLINRKINHDMLQPFISSQRYLEIKEDSSYEWERWVLQNWAPTNLGKSMKLSDFISQYSAYISSGGKPPGQKKFEELARKNPETIKVNQPFRHQGDGSRFIQSLLGADTISENVREIRNIVSEQEDAG